MRSFTLQDLGQLKAGAKRLAKHFGERHRFKLRYSAALEAVAALHGAADWNTLCAHVEAGAALSDKPPREPEYPLAASGPNSTPYSLQDRDFFRHALVTGGTAAEREIWGLEHTRLQIASKVAGVGLNVLAPLRTSGKLDKSIAALATLDFQDTNAQPRFNVLASLDEQEAAGLVLSTVKMLEAPPWRDETQAFVHQTLVLLLRELRHEESAICWHELLQAVEAFRSTAAPHAQQGTSGPLVRASQEQLHALAYVEQAMVRAEKSTELRQVLSSDKNAPGLLSLFEDDQFHIVELGHGPGELRAVQVDWMLRCAASAVVRSLRQRPTGGRKPRSLALVEVAHLISPAHLARMFEQARAARLALAMTGATMEDIARHAGTQVVNNAWSHIRLGGLSHDDARELCNTLEKSKSVLAQPGCVEYR